MKGYRELTSTTYCLENISDGKCETTKLVGLAFALHDQCTTHAMQGNLVAKSYLYFKARDVHRLEWTFC